MNLNFENINKNEILYILQYKGSEIPIDIEKLINDSIEDLKKHSNIKYKFIELPMNSKKLENILVGNDILKLLDSSERVLLVGATLGVAIEMLIRKYTYSELVRSVILDATASAGVESVMNDINNFLIEKYKPKYLTDRFSPGYGDMPIIIQKEFLQILNAEKHLGITTNESGIMIPRKSITAIIGISNVVQNHRHIGCENCRLYLECEFLKRGETCGYKK